MIEFESIFRGDSFGYFRITTFLLYGTSFPLHYLLWKYHCCKNTNTQVDVAPVHQKNWVVLLLMIILNNYMEF